MTERNPLDEPARWRDVISEADLWEGDLHVTEIDGMDIFLVNVGGIIRAYEDRCPHQRNPLSDGHFNEGTLTCKYHRWRFDLATGKGINPADCRLAALETRIESGMVQVSPRMNSSTARA